MDVSQLQMQEIINCYVDISANLRMENSTWLSEIVQRFMKDDPVAFLKICKEVDKFLGFSDIEEMSFLEPEEFPSAESCGPTEMFMMLQNSVYGTQA